MRIGTNNHEEEFITHKGKRSNWLKIIGLAALSLLLITLFLNPFNKIGAEKGVEVHEEGNNYITSTKVLFDTFLKDFSNPADGIKALDERIKRVTGKEPEDYYKIIKMPFVIPRHSFRPRFPPSATRFEKIKLRLEFFRDKDFDFLANTPTFPGSERSFDWEHYKDQNILDLLKIVEDLKILGNYEKMKIAQNSQEIVKDVISAFPSEFGTQSKENIAEFEKLEGECFANGLSFKSDGENFYKYLIYPLDSAFFARKKEQVYIGELKLPYNVREWILEDFKQYVNLKKTGSLKNYFSYGGCGKLMEGRFDLPY